MSESRQTARRRVCLGGRIRTAAFLPEIPCTLRDVSVAGARIRLDPGVPLPPLFDLSVPCRGETRRAWLIWRAGDAAGLSFEGPAQRRGAGTAVAPPGPGTGRPGRLH